MSLFILDLGNCQLPCCLALIVLYCIAIFSLFYFIYYTVSLYCISSLWTLWAPVSVHRTLVSSLTVICYCILLSLVFLCRRINWLIDCLVFLTRSVGTYECSESPGMTWRDKCHRSCRCRYIVVFVTLLYIVWTLWFIADFNRRCINTSAMTLLQEWNATSLLCNWNDSPQSRENLISRVCINNVTGAVLHWGRGRGHQWRNY